MARATRDWNRGHERAKVRIVHPDKFTLLIVLRYNTNFITQKSIVTYRAPKHIQRQRTSQSQWSTPGIHRNFFAWVASCRCLLQKNRGILTVAFRLDSNDQSYLEPRASSRTYHRHFCMFWTIRYDPIQTHIADQESKEYLWFVSGVRTLFVYF